MTEAEWHTCTDSQKMLEFLKGKASDRKLRLFACACYRRIWPLLSDHRSQLAVEFGEQCADGKVTDEEQFAAYELACDAKDDAWGGAYENADFPAVAASYVLGHDPAAALVAGLTATAGNNPRVRQPGEMAFQCYLLREIVGNPSRLIFAAPTWLTPTVLALAQAAYDNRTLPAGHLDNARLGILGDALEEADCSNADILDHLRGSGPHYRGCWCLDMLLGKE
jgi:hypothetical protein